MSRVVDRHASRGARRALQSGRLRLECREGRSYKFYLLEKVDVDSFVARFGRIGTGGRCLPNRLTEDGAVERAVEKIRKGYSVIVEGKSAPAESVPLHSRVSKVTFRPTDLMHAAGLVDGRKLLVEYGQAETNYRVFGAGNLRGALIVLATSQGSHAWGQVPELV